MHPETTQVLEKPSVLAAVNKSGRAYYTEEDSTILETLTSQATPALLDVINHSQKCEAWHGGPGDLYICLFAKPNLVNSGNHLLIS
jgi:hypothetical protein